MMPGFTRTTRGPLTRGLLAHGLFTLGLLSLAGCFSLARTSPALSQYVLGGALVSAEAVPTPGAATADAPLLMMGLRRIELASYLATPAIVVRRGAHQIVTSEFHRWGEELGAGINRTVAAHLSSGPGRVAVDVAPWPARSQHDVLVRLRVSRFEGIEDSLANSAGVHVQIAWDVLRPEDDSLLARGVTDYRDGRWTPGDYGSLVRELDAALVQVARELRERLAALPDRRVLTPP